MTEKKYVTQEDFKRFKENDFYHLSEKVENIGKKVAHSRGMLFILVPLVLMVLGAIIGTQVYM